MKNMSLQALTSKGKICSIRLSGMLSQNLLRDYIRTNSVFKKINIFLIGFALSFYNWKSVFVNKVIIERLIERENHWLND